MHSKAAVTLGAIVLFAFVLVSYSIGNTEAIWLQTRILGLISYGFLFLAVNIGLAKMLTKGSRSFDFFRFHVPASIASVVFTFTHFISAFLDSYKWGETLTASQYIGFSFSDEWVTLISIGVLSFYIMVLVSVTSPPKIVRYMGFKRWKAIHYLSYIAFYMAYVHSANLGTDLKTSSIAPLIHPLVFASFVLTLSLFTARVLKGAGLTGDLSESGLIIVFMFFLVILSSDMAGMMRDNKASESASQNRLDIQGNGIGRLEAQLDHLKNDTGELGKAIAEVKYGKNS